MGEMGAMIVQLSFSSCHVSFRYFGRSFLGAGAAAAVVSCWSSAAGENRAMGAGCWEKGEDEVGFELSEGATGTNFYPSHSCKLVITSTSNILTLT
jgi:hypothetical protein